MCPGLLLLCPAPSTTQQVPQEQWADTPIQLMATAGVRLLKNGSADRIMSEVCGRVGGGAHSRLGACPYSRALRHGRLAVPHHYPVPGL